MLKFLFPILFAAGLAAANEAMCERLCEPCKGQSSEDATCANVNEVCKCGELFERLEAEAAAKSQRNEARREALGNALYEECKLGKCALTLEFEGAALTLEASETENAALAKEPEPKPLASECVELCRVIAENPGNQMAEQIESSCGCAAHVQDSLRLVEFRLARLQAAKVSADSVAQLCEGSEVCKVDLVLDPSTFGIASITIVEASKPEGDSAKLAPQAYNAARRTALGNALHEACLQGKCLVKLGFEEGTLTQNEPQTLDGEAAFPEPSVKTLSNECAELCKVVPSDSGNPMTAEIENSCGCSAHLQDSLKLEAFRAARLAHSGAAADSVVNFCAERQTCNVAVSLNSETFELTAINFAEREPPSLKPNLVVLGKAEPEQPRQQTLEPKEKKEKRMRSYFGFTLFVDFMFRGSVNHLHHGLDEVIDYDGEDSYGGTIGFLWRYYFLETEKEILGLPLLWASFQTGLNIAYNVSNFDVDKTWSYKYSYNIYTYTTTYYFTADDVWYHTISPEIPLQIRLGVLPLYGTAVLTIRKPLWEDLFINECYVNQRINYGAYYDGDYHERYLEDTNSSQVLGINYWNFMLHVGFGVEITKHFSVEWLFLLFDKGTADYHMRQSDAWRVKMDFAF